MFLVGVFLTGAPESGVGLGSQVTSIGDYDGGGGLSATQTTFTPLVGQTFFIGDGSTGTGSGAIQQFVVPTGTTPLFLGFAEKRGYVDSCAVLIVTFFGWGPCGCGDRFAGEPKPVRARPCPARGAESH
jgi:hypothetical protein